VLAGRREQTGIGSNPDFFQDEGIDVIGESDHRQGKPAITLESVRGFFSAPSGRGIAVRLLVSVLLFSSAVTLTLTALELYLDYKRDIAAIDVRLDEIQEGYAESLAESLWNLDTNQLQLQVAGIRRFPDVTFVEVRGTDTARDSPVVAAGQPGARSIVVREFRLSRLTDSVTQPFGTVRVEASLTSIYQELKDRTLILLLIQGAKTFLVSLFIVYIFHRLVTRHLLSIARFVGHYDLTHPPPPLSLQRVSPRQGDELDELVEAFNMLCAGLQHAYQDLKKSEQRFRDYAETASDWYWETGPDHRFTYLSDPYRASFGERIAIIGKSRRDLAPQGELGQARWREHIAMLDRHEPFRNFEYTLRVADKLARHVSNSGRPIFDDAGRFMGYRGTTTDLTAQREAEERLRQTQKMDAIGQLTGGIAHDFNNILTVIMGIGELLQESLADRPQLAATAKLIDDAATRGAALTQQLLAFARKQMLAPRATDVNALVTETVNLLRSTLGEQIEIQVTPQRDAWPAMIDPSQLSTALLNLALNARDAMPDGGKLMIETSNVVLDDASAKANPEITPGSYVLVAVADNGSGIPAAVRDKVFEPFFTTKQVGKGTGLGLSMVYGFAKQSGGHVTITSEEGHGTTIRIYLPRTGDDGASSELLEHKVAARSGNETILVVEDDEMVRTSVIRQLEGLGYRTLAAGNGAQALALVDQGAQFDLLFTDIVMPGGINGAELGREVARRRPAVKTLYTSGYSEDGIVHQGRLDPGVVLLGKPYRKLDLARKIRDVLGDQDNPTE
jgi:PAS domain S-box-containing protein